MTMSMVPPQSPDRMRAFGLCLTVRALLFLWICGIGARPISAQEGLAPTQLDPDQGGRIVSMGQPPIWKWYTTYSAGSWGLSEPRAFMSYLDLGVFRDIGSPIVSALGWEVEGYIGGRSGRDEIIDGGFRAIIRSPFLRLGGGLDYNIGSDRGDVLFRFDAPTIRGGVVRGVDLQLNWWPWRDHSWSVGLAIPLNQPWRGRSRPRRAHQSLDAPDLPQIAYELDVPQMSDALANLGEAADWLNRLSTPFMDQGGFKREKADQEFRDAMGELDTHIRQTSALYPDGRGPLEEQRVMHLEMDRLFSMAESGQSLSYGESTETGRALAELAREVLRADVIYPYNRLLGQTKKKDTIRGYAVVAAENFRRGTAQELSIRSDRASAVEHVFNELLFIFEQSREFTSEAWGDSRLGWIPLQFALRPEDYDEREELNAIVEDVVGHDWTDGNDVYYVTNAQWQWELQASILAAEDYHVLWIHDIASFNSAGAPDRVTFIQMISSYYGAMTERVKQYDVTGKLPVYMIFFDQHYL